MTLLKSLYNILFFFGARKGGRRIEETARMEEVTLREARKEGKTAGGKPGENSRWKARI
jgi:hypothetical protein